MNEMTEDIKVELIGAYFTANIYEHPKDFAAKVIKYVRALDSYRSRDSKGRFVKVRVS